MIILLTGKPGIGKSTVIEKFISANKEPATWVVTSDIRRPESGDRSGFAATNSDGVRRIISHKTDIESDVVIGVNRVDLAAVDAMFADALKSALRSDGKLTIVDEIGPIQLLSPAFANALDSVFDSGADVVATIHYSDERLDKYRTATGALLLDVTAENRDMLPDALVLMTKNRQVFNRLTLAQRTAANNLLRSYIEQSKLLQIQKLMENAVHYVDEGRVTRPAEGHWMVTGRHGRYNVSLQDGALACGCDLFNGRGQYAGSAGVCSHVQAATIFDA